MASFFLRHRVDRSPSIVDSMWVLFFGQVVAALAANYPTHRGRKHSENVLEYAAYGRITSLLSKQRDLVVTSALFCCYSAILSIWFNVKRCIFIEQIHFGMLISNLFNVYAKNNM